MRLYIAEKPGLGRAIATALERSHGRAKREQGCIRLGDAAVVSWCIGHLLEQVEPEVYDPRFKRWSHEHLPIIPTEWKLKPRKQSAAQFKVLRKLIREADELVHAGDPDREGQLLVDEVLHHVGIKGRTLKNVKRCLINDLNPSAVRKSLDNLRPNSDFEPLSTSALARSRADWLYGINMTRAYTLQGQKAGYRGVLSVGRVQTPVLGLVVRRELAIRDFVSQAYFEVWAHLRTEDGATFAAKWVPSKACEPYLDEASRNLSQSLAENVRRRISHKTAVVKAIERRKKVLPPPLPYNLSALQMDANRVFGLSAQQVLDTCQSLYEKHTLITYPRSDCRYLPEAHWTEAPVIVETIQKNLQSTGFKDYAVAWAQLDTTKKTRAWNDKRVDAHHAIIPTRRRATTLSTAEQQVYRLICRHYLTLFLPDHVFFETRVDVIIEAGLFVARAREPSIEGWKILHPRKSKSPRQSSARKKTVSSDSPSTESLLPALTKGQQLASLEGEIREKKTTAPAHFTDATLLAAMTGISQFVHDKALKKILRDTDGLGTEATRAGIIELLLRRQFIERQQKNLRASVTGIALIQALPDAATLPDMTARWESSLTAISQSSANYASLMDPLVTQLRTLITQSRTILPTGLLGLGNAATPRKNKKRSGKGLATRRPSSRKSGK